MSADGLRYDRYDVGGRGEWRMQIGPEDGVPILLVPPLFEEMNRSRALLAAVMRGLAGKRFRCTLPDLPGTGESERALETCSWADWQDAIGAADTPALVASFRGGALLDGVEASAWWRFAPVGGAPVMRDLERASAAAQPRSSRALSDADSERQRTRDERRSLAGYQTAEALVGPLGQAQVQDVAPCRTVRLASDPKPADLKLEGPTLWRRSEPASSSELAQLIASDISYWARQCGIC